jgi:hypothetical protein
MSPAPERVRIFLNAPRLPSPEDAIFTCFFNDWRRCAYMPRFGTRLFDGDEFI